MNYPNLQERWYKPTGPDSPLFSFPRLKAEGNAVVNFSPKLKFIKNSSSHPHSPRVGFVEEKRGLKEDEESPPLLVFLNKGKVSLKKQKKNLSPCPL